MTAVDTVDDSFVDDSFVDDVNKKNDDIINRKNEYHKKFETVDVRMNVIENIMLLFVILIPVIGMYALFRLKRKRCLVGEKSNTMFSLLTVSLLMTASETIFVYWYNIQRTHNNIFKKLERSIEFNQYMSMKNINNDIPNVIHTEFKKSYERNLQSITFIMLIPIFLICIFMMSLLSGCMTMGYKDVFGIIINVLLLIVIFGITFVNLGSRQSEPVDFKKLADTFDPYNDIHRFQKSFSFLTSKYVLGSFSGLMGGVIAFSFFVYKYK